jgi:hypothetical protein
MYDLVKEAGWSTSLMTLMKVSHMTLVTWVICDLREGGRLANSL